MLKIQEFTKIELGLSVDEFMNSDEYLGGMSSTTIKSVSARRIFGANFTS
jgi:hypothetical protein